MTHDFISGKRAQPRLLRRWRVAAGKVNWGQCYARQTGTRKFHHVLKRLTPSSRKGGIGSVNPGHGHLRDAQPILGWQAGSTPSPIRVPFVPDESELAQTGRTLRLRVDRQGIPQRLVRQRARSAGGPFRLSLDAGTENPPGAPLVLGRRTVQSMWENKLQRCRRLKPSKPPAVPSPRTSRKKKITPGRLCRHYLERSPCHPPLRTRA